MTRAQEAALAFVRERYSSDAWFDTAGPNGVHDHLVRRGLVRDSVRSTAAGRILSRLVQDGYLRRRWSVFGACWEYRLKEPA